MATDRARQFLPFDSLTGLKEYYKKMEKPVISKHELMMETKDELYETLSSLKKGSIVEIVYFHLDEYIKITGVVSKIDITNQEIQIVKTKIKIDDIYSCNLINNIN